MTQEAIRKNVDQLNKIIEDNMKPGVFILNEIVSEAQRKIKILQSSCKHEFENGICIYCDKSEGAN